MLTYRIKIVLPRLYHLAAKARRYFGRTLLLAGALVLLGWAGLAGARTLEARHHWQAAQAALARDDLDLAQQHLEQCLQFRTDRAEVYLLAAQTARRREDFDQADAHLAVCERLGGAAEAALLERALLIAQQGEPGHVSKQLGAVGKSRPDQAVPILEALGKGCFHSYAYEDALSCFSTLLQRQPDHARALLWRGKTYAGMKRWDEALHDYHRAALRAPALDEARLGLATTLWRLGRGWEALPHFACLQQRQPASAEVLLGLARCRYEQQEVEAARQLLETLLAAHPDHAAGLLARGQLAFHAGQAAEAEPWLRRALAAAPHDRETQRALLLCLQEQGKDAAARQCLAQQEASEADSAAAHLLMQQAWREGRGAPLCRDIGARLLELGREPEAASWYFGALGADEDDAAAHAALADYFQRHGQRYRAARHQLRKVAR